MGWNWRSCCAAAGAPGDRAWRRSFSRSPPGLARLLCARNCVVTRNISSLEPGQFQRKYYAPGIGVFLETAPQTGEVNRLVKCNFDPRCAQLPQ